MMDAATRNLRCYHNARLLHLVPQFFYAQEENCFLVPLFYSCVSAEAKKYARLVLLCLMRSTGSMYASEVGLRILSFLSFPEFSAPRPSMCPPVPSVTNRAKRERADEPPPEENKKQKKELTDEHDSAPRASGGEGGSTAKPEPQPEEESEKKIQEDALDEERLENTDKHLFFVHPPPLASEVTRLFVRMATQNPLNEETLNTFFGRYGQVSCALLNQRPLHGDEQSRLVQDFIVTVDSPVNALQAVRNAYYRELIFIALHDPAYNAYKASDVDNVLGQVDVVILNEQTQRQTNENDDDAKTLSLRSFIPDIIVDGLPYWMTVDQLRASFSEYGRVVDVRISVDDRSGAFTGAVLLRMSSVEEALAVSEGLHGEVFKGNELRSGVLDDRLNIVSLRQGTIIGRADRPFPEDCDITENERLWV